jgi:hypothetical protein
LEPGAETLEAGPALSDLIVRDCLERFPFVQLRVSGECMRPGLAAGATVCLASPARRPPRLGDVVLVRLPTGLRLHRLVWGPPLAPPGTRWRTKGDRSWLWDPLLDPQHVLATVVDEGQEGGVWRGLLSLLGGLWSRLRLVAAVTHRP